MNTRPKSYQIIVDILLLVNEDHGEVVGRLKRVDKKISIQEILRYGNAVTRKNEVSEGQTVDDKYPLQFFACAAPQDQQD